jgi:hypothetical protein
MFAMEKPKGGVEGLTAGDAAKTGGVNAEVPTVDRFSNTTPEITRRIVRFMKLQHLRVFSSSMSWFT